jgi:hypothetical protein
MTKVMFRVFVTRRCRVCKKIHPMPTHRYVDHYGEGSPEEEIQVGHTLWANALEQENERAERRDRDRNNRKAGTGRMHTNMRQRPLYQYHFEVK